MSVVPISAQNIDFRPKLRFSSEVMIFRPNSWFSPKVVIFVVRSADFRQNINFHKRSCDCPQNYGFRQSFDFPSFDFVQVSNFRPSYVFIQSFDSCPKFWFLSKNYDFSPIISSQILAQKVLTHIILSLLSHLIKAAEFWAVQYRILPRALNSVKRTDFYLMYRIC